MFVSPSNFAHCECHDQKFGCLSNIWKMYERTRTINRCSNQLNYTFWFNKRFFSAKQHWKSDGHGCGVALVLLFYLANTMLVCEISLLKSAIGKGSWMQHGLLCGWRCSERFNPAVLDCVWQKPYVSGQTSPCEKFRTGFEHRTHLVFVFLC